MPIKTSTGQTAAQMAQQSGVAQSEVMNQQAIDPNQNPDVTVGGALDARKTVPTPIAPPERSLTDAPPPVVATSNAARAEDEKTGAEITTTTAGLSETAQGAFTTALDLLDTTAANIKADKETGIANMQNQMAIGLDKTATAQRQEKGTSGMALARMGGALGGSGSTLAYMNSLSGRHRIEAADIESRYLGAIEAAKMAYNSQDIDVAREMLNAANGYQTQLNNQRTLAMQEASMAMELQTFERETDALTLDSWAAQGYTEDEIPEGMFTEMDKVNGYRDGTSRGLFGIASEERASAKTKSDFEQATDLMAALDTVPIGQPIQIGENTYYGTSGAGVIETDPEGYGYTFAVDQETGAISKRTLGYVGKEKDGFQIIKDGKGRPWSMNPNTGERYAMFGSMAEWDLLAPDGEVWDNFGERTANKGQCGALINDIYTDIHVVDSLESKLEVTDPSIKAENVEEGNFIVMSGGTTGHIASVEEVDYQDGKKMLRLFEANANGDLKTTHNRWVEADDPLIKGYGKGTLRPEFMTGTDNPVFAPTQDTGGMSVSERLALLRFETEQTEKAVEAEKEAEATEKQKDVGIIQLDSKIDLLDNILSHGSLGASVGPHAISRLAPVARFSGGRSDFTASVDQLVSKGTLDALLELKSRGGTLGAISQSELNILQNAATKINSWKVKDKDGNVTGFNASEESFKRELNSMKAVTMNWKELAVGSSTRYKVNETTGEIETIADDDDTITIGDDASIDSFLDSIE